MAVAEVVVTTASEAAALLEALVGPVAEVVVTTASEAGAPPVVALIDQELMVEPDIIESAVAVATPVAAHRDRQEAVGQVLVVVVPGAPVAEVAATAESVAGKVLLVVAQVDLDPMAVLELHAGEVEKVSVVVVKAD